MVGCFAPTFGSESRVEQKYTYCLGFGARPGQELVNTKRVPGQVGNPGNKESWLGEVDEKMPM
jgi:hypothetical protein